MDNITIAIEELYLSGAISIIGRSRSTVYRWMKAINERLEFEKCDWRVKANYKDCIIEVI
jgi:transposase